MLQHGAEYDVGAGEFTRNNDNAKLYHHLGKLLREVKNVLDSLLLNTKYTIEAKMEKSAMFIKKSVNSLKKHSESNTFNRQDSFENEHDDVHSWKRPT